jgi:Domain of unknown function (DUF3291)
VAGHHLAQLNIARFLAPIDDPQLRDFVAALDPVNAQADDADGFVWRLQTDDGNATSIQAFDDPLMLVNMSVWESLEALRAFVYTNRNHLAIMRRRREFAETMLQAYLALWWVPAGHIPTVGEALERLELLREHGPTPDAFTFRASFGPPDGEAAASEVVDDDRWLCPA